MLCPLAERRLQQVVQNDKDVYTLYSSPHGALIATAEVLKYEQVLKAFSSPHGALIATRS